MNKISFWMDSLQPNNILHSFFCQKWLNFSALKFIDIKFFVRCVPIMFLLTAFSFLLKLFNLTFSIDSNQSKGRAYIIKIEGEREVGSSYYVCSRKYIMLQYLEKKYFELWFPFEFLRSRIFNGAKLTSQSVPWHW